MIQNRRPMQGRIAVDPNQQTGKLHNPDDRSRDLAARCIRGEG